jgi:predicted nucleic acid-binding protein
MTWLASVDAANLHVSAMTIGELQAGVEATRDIDPTKAGQIESWLEQIAQTYSVLPLDSEILRCWARLMHKRSDDLIADAFIAATAAVHDLVVATRNIRDFHHFGVRTFNPFR